MLFLGVTGAGMGGVAAAVAAAGPKLMMRLAKEARRIPAQACFSSGSGVVSLSQNAA